jgi:cell fate regulator YaaT (PSP1 superfamily)
MYYFSPGEFTDLAVSDPVIVETALGEELGWVVMPPTVIQDEDIKGRLKPVLRRANPLDLTSMADYQQREAAALDRCREKVAELGLPMKVIKAEYSFDGQRLLFSFLSEDRVDFRELVRVLARSFRARIEMKQIGARDEAKLLGGFGRCGRRLCCSCWLAEFHPVSIKMAKQQDLPLTPAEISGVCGRLLCCLAYENEQYADIKQTMPRVGTQVNTAEGKGVVVGLNVLTESAQVELQSELTIEVKSSELEVIPDAKRVSRPRGKSRQ